MADLDVVSKLLEINTEKVNSHDKKIETLSGELKESMLISNTYFKRFSSLEKKVDDIIEILHKLSSPSKEVWDKEKMVQDSINLCEKRIDNLEVYKIESEKLIEMVTAKLSKFGFLFINPKLTIVVIIFLIFSVTDVIFGVEILSKIWQNLISEL